MGAVHSDEGCSICGVRGKALDTPLGRPLPAPPKLLGSTPPRLGAGCASPRPPSRGRGPVIDAQPIASTIPPFGWESPRTSAAEDEWDRASDCGSQLSYSAALEGARKSLMTAVKKEQFCGNRAVAHSTLTSRSSLGSPNLEPSRHTSLVTYETTRSAKTSEREREFISEGRLVDLRYHEMRVGDRVRGLRSFCRGRPQKTCSSGQWRSNIEVQAKEVKEYQDAMKQHLSRIAPREHEFLSTRNPAAAVREGVARYYETCGEVGTLEPEELARNPDMEHQLSSEERAQINANVVQLRRRSLQERARPQH